MCGLVGVAGNLFGGDRKAFRNLLVFDTVRGDHSTGVAAIKMSEDISLFKDIGHPYNLFETYSDDFDKGGVPTAVTAKVFLGHNRYGTMGRIIPENAHPFFHGDIVGAHNGTLEKRFLSNLDDHDKFEVDSEALIYNIAKHGPEIIKKVAGAYALTWYDKKQKKMFFIRNSKRPLWYARSKDKDTFYWASEPWMITYGCGKAGVAVEAPTEFETDHLYSIDVSHGTMKFRESILEKGEKIEGFTPPVQVMYQRPTGTGVGGKSNGMSGNHNNPFAGRLSNGGPVVPLPNFQPKVATPEVTREYARKLETYVGKTIEFWADMERTTDNGLVFLSCSPINTTDDFEIRLFTAGKEVHRQYYLARKPLKGVVKKVVRNTSISTGKPDIYVLMDYRSISFDPEEANVGSNVVPIKRVGKKDSKRGDFRGYLGVPLTEEEWITATACGCAYCDSAVVPEEASKLMWFGRTDFLCPPCTEDPAKKKFAESIQQGS